MKMRLDQGKISFKSSEVGKFHGLEDLGLWGLLTTTYDQHAAICKSSKVPSDFLPDTKFHFTFREVLVKLGIIKATDTTEYAYNYHGKRLLGQALSTALFKVSMALNQACGASDIWQSIAGNSEDAERKHKLLDLSVASRSVKNALDYLSDLMASCVVLNDGHEYDLLARYLVWVGQCHNLNNTANHLSQRESSSKKETQILKASQVTLGLHKPKFSSVIPPSRTSSSTCSTPPNFKDTLKSSSTSDSPLGALGSTHTASGSSTTRRRSSNLPSETESKADALANDKLEDFDALSQDDFTLNTLDRADEQLEHWAAKAKRWLNTILLHWRALDNVIRPCTTKRNSIRRLETSSPSDAELGSSGPCNREILNINGHFEALTKGHCKPIDKRRKRLMEWLSKTEQKKAWFGATEFNGNMYCEGIFKVFRSLEADIRQNTLWSTGFSEPDQKPDAGNHEINASLSEPISTRRRVVAVSRGCCSGSICLISLAYTRTKRQILKRADDSGVAHQTEVDIMQTEPGDWWFGVPIPRSLQYQCFEKIATNARKRVEEWADLIFSDLPIDEKKKRKSWIGERIRC
ncbi:hypothetical protein MMC10_003996 [Thelotrema lepadinum]|nr:hypothetical protein [Thelotrema lepadinum]